MRLRCLSSLLLLGHACADAPLDALVAAPAPETVSLRFVLELPPDDPPLQDLPVAVFLRPDRFDTSVSADGGDLRFVDESGARLAHEVDTWAATGIVWVRIPEARDGTVFFLAEGFEPVTGDVWADYEGVWHLNDLEDSAAPTPLPSARSEPSAGLVGGAQAVSGAGGIRFTERDLLGGAAGATLSAWVFPDRANGQIISISDSTGLGNSRAFLSLENGRVAAGAKVAPEQERPQVESASVVAAARWYHLAATTNFADGDLAIFVDGERVSTLRAEFGAARVEDAPAALVVFGDEEDATDGRAFFGRLDEIRVSRRAFSPARVMAEARSARDELVRYERVVSE
ncbi:MAG: LamG-like jellyroll fold domain-containing protein [Myxococcota bacterium]